MMNRTCAVYGLVMLCLCAAVSAAATEQTSKDGELAEVLFYRNERAFSSFVFVEVTVLADGSSLVAYDRGKGAKEAKFRLNESELSALGTLVDAVGFFSLGEPSSRYAIDAGSSTLRVSLTGRNREMHYGYVRGIKPLMSFIWKLISQATTVAGLRESGDVYQARGALDPRLAAPKILQPRVLRKPLEAFLRATIDHNKLPVALDALSWVTTPAEWMGFIAAQLDGAHGEHRDLWLSRLVDSSFPQDYSDMLSLLLLKILREEYPNWDSLSEKRQRALSTAIRLLGARAVPVTLQTNPGLYTEKHLTPGMLALVRDAESNLPDVVALLAYSLHAGTRAAAARVLGITFDKSREYYIQRNVSSQALDKALKFAKTVSAPLLKERAAYDKDEHVRSAAAQSLDAIERGWKSAKN